MVPSRLSRQDPFGQEKNMEQVREGERDNTAILSLKTYV